MIATGAALLVAFVYWQSINPHEPLILLKIFRDRNFTLSALGGAVIGFVVTAMILPVMFYAPVVAGLSYTRSALLTAPDGDRVRCAGAVGGPDRRPHPSDTGDRIRLLHVGDRADLAVVRADTGDADLAAVAAAARRWASAWRSSSSPLAATATRYMSPESAGAGSGVYNATRQVVRCWAAPRMAAFMTFRISAELADAGVEVTRRRPGPGTSGIPARRVLRGTGAVAAAAGVHRPRRCGGRGSSCAASATGLERTARGRCRHRNCRRSTSSTRSTWTGTTRTNTSSTPSTGSGRSAPRTRRPISSRLSATSPPTPPTDRLYEHVEHPLHATVDTWHPGPGRNLAARQR